MLLKSNKDYNELKAHFIDPLEHWKLRRMVLNENYRVIYGITTQLMIDNNSFGAIQRTDVDNVANIINYQTIMGEFIDVEVFKYTGIALDEYIGLPKHVRDDMLTRIRRLKEEKNNLVNTIINAEEKNS